MDAASPSGGVCGVDDSYKQLHGIATTPRRELNLDLTDGQFAIAVLHHGSTGAPNPEDFYWFKAKYKHSISKIKSAYSKRVEITNITLHYANKPISYCTQMRHLNYTNDNIVILTAHENEMNPQLPAHANAGTLLQPTPTKTQLPINTNMVGGADSTDIKVKMEDAHVSPSEGLDKNIRSIESTYSDRVPRPYQAIKPENKDGSLASESLSIKREAVAENHSMGEADPLPDFPAPKQPTQNERTQRIISEGTPEELEAEVASCQSFLQNLKKPMEEFVGQNKDAQHWVSQIDSLIKQNVDTPTIIGVVGNTGAGKSSVINAVLEEERLVPTNCMRACTAVVTEMSYNHSDNPNALYRADIEFIQEADWAKDLKTSLTDLIDSNGQVSRECTNPESEAGVAYAKIKAVYPSWTKDELAHSSVEKLMNEDEVKKVLGTIRTIEKSKPEFFYKALQNYVDSKEKSTDKKTKGEKKQMEFWPLIKVVRIYTKADALSTGAVIVDLPGVHDSNAARAAVAQGYMKQCTGLFIVAPINRAVDDKAAKSLLGESFKRQLKFDGTYSRITFICSKTDDISIIEASDSLGLEDEMKDDWDRLDTIEKEQSSLRQSVKDLKESKGVFSELINDADDAIEVWDKLKELSEDGETVYDPSKKRKRDVEPNKPWKKAKKSSDDNDEGGDAEDDDIDDDENYCEEEKTPDAESDAESASKKGDPLTIEEIEAKISQFKDAKKRARNERLEAETKIKSLNSELKNLEKARLEIDTAMSAICIEGRNNYSKGAIQRDFADGIRELDMEAAQEEDPDQFDPENDLRDYEEVARSLKVFCVSSRAYQKFRGRLQRDKDVPGFRTAEETEIPQLQAHCKMLTEAGRASNCRNYLANICQLLNSLGLWASNDGTALNLTGAQLATETHSLKLGLQKLEDKLAKAVKQCLKDLTDALAENIFENYEQLVESAISEANATVQAWHGPVNRGDRASGGYYWATYKAIMRRDGVYSNAHGPHDFNLSLLEPLIKHLASHWERTFAKRMPRILASFSKKAKSLLNAFHHEIELQTLKAGSGAARIALLGDQLKNYETIFATMSQRMIETINDHQREANRAFTPVIARNLATAYQWCTQISGPGQFKKMKSHMEDHIDSAKETMFSESCEEVQRLLLEMCRQVEQDMSDNTGSIFARIERDYLEAISGNKLPGGQTMPKFELNMRSKVAKIIADREMFILEAEAKAALDAGNLATQKDDETPGVTSHGGSASSPNLAAGNVNTGLANDEMNFA
ncbi:hypothetical protein BUE80_DR001561 [Diplocarpon rosae]|nr:hypothetical protein BUE80_DR001561 [Diplocarpon rosae]